MTENETIEEESLESAVTHAKSLIEPQPNGDMLLKLAKPIQVKGQDCKSILFKSMATVLDYENHANFLKSLLANCNIKETELETVNMRLATNLVRGLFAQYATFNDQKIGLLARQDMSLADNLRATVIIDSMYFAPFC